MTSLLAEDEDWATGWFFLIICCANVNTNWMQNEFQEFYGILKQNLFTL